MPRFYCDMALQIGLNCTLPPEATRHVQVLRMQPEQTIGLFNGQGGEFEATILQMGRSSVEVHIASHNPIEREHHTPIHLAVGMPANDRMDWLVEKATELGVASIQPLHTAHSVLRLKADRAEKKQQHWQSIAIAACEQCGRNRIPTIHPVADIAPWLSQSATSAAQRYVLSLAQPAQTLAPPHSTTSCPDGIVFLNGPEGGLQAQEEQLALKHGWQPLSLGPRVLRAETAALAALMQCALPTQPFLSHQAPQ